MKKTIVILIHALLGWIICGMIMFIGPNVTSMLTTMIVHAIAVPIVFALISYFYFKRFAYTTSVQTAFIFFVFVVLMDVFLVSLIIQKNFSMFTDRGSILGTYIPIILIFVSTYVTGIKVTRTKKM